jgi:hypothetical protein
VKAKLSGLLEEASRQWWRSWRFEAGTATTFLVSDVSGKVVGVTDRDMCSIQVLRCRADCRDASFSRRVSRIGELFQTPMGLFSGMNEVGVSDLPTCGSRRKYSIPFETSFIAVAIDLSAIGNTLNLDAPGISEAHEKACSQ